MQDSITIKSLFIALISATFFLALSGCSEKKEAPDPPLTQSKTLLEMFDALEKGDHETALNKIVKLRELDKTNMLLAKMENQEKNNVCISRAQEALEKNDPDSALLIIEDGLAILGRSDTLIKAKEDILKIKAIPALLESLNNPVTHIKTAKDAVKLKEIIHPYPKISRLYADYIKERIEIAYQLERNEKWLYLADFAADINSLLEKASPDVHLAMARLAVEAPKHPLVIEYTNWLESSIKNSKFDPLLNQPNY